jgi:hypothetical protein
VNSESQALQTRRDVEEPLEVVAGKRDIEGACELAEARNGERGFRRSDLRRQLIEFRDIEGEVEVV